jgi:hypothetical protein
MQKNSQGVTFALLAAVKDIERAIQQGKAL